MQFLKAYKVIPLHGNVVRLYEFRGHYHYLVDPAENNGHSVKTNPKASLSFLCVLAENLYDAVVYLRLVYPQFSPYKVAIRNEVQVEIPPSKLNMLPKNGDAS